MLAVQRLAALCCLCLLGPGLLRAAYCEGGKRKVTETSESAARPGELLAYVGTYTQGKSQGIYLFRFDPATGKLTAAGVTPHVVNPSFLAISPNHRFLYAVNETDNYQGTKGGAVSAFKIDSRSGNLTLLNQQATGGGAPCFVTVDKTGKCALVANYSGGSVAAFPIQADGSLGAATAIVQHHGKGPNPQRQEGPHAHSINLDASNEHAYAADLGLDKILIYAFDPAKASLDENDPHEASTPPGSGPRHFVFHPNQRFAYVINEMGCSVTAFAYDSATGGLKPLQTISTLPKDFHGSSNCAEVQISPNGRYLYGSNRGRDTIAIFSIDPNTGHLTYVGEEPTGGKTPRNFRIDPSGTYLLAANQDSDSIVVFRIDAQNGRLHRTGHSVEVPMPVCIKFMPAPR